MISLPAERTTTYPYPIYLNGMHLERDRALVVKQQDDYQRGKAFEWAITDIAWMANLEATHQKLMDEAPGYPATFYKLHLAEQLAFAICIEHPLQNECLALLMQQEVDPEIIPEMVAVSKRMQRRNLPDKYQWVQPADTQGKLRDIRQLTQLGLVSEESLVERALRSQQSVKIIQEMIETVEPEAAKRMREQLVRALLVSDETQASRLRTMLGLGPCMGTWEASRRFTLMFEYAAQGLLDEHQLFPEILSANLDAGIGVQMSILVDDRIYLKDMAQKDLTRMIERILQEALRYPNVFDPDKPPLLPDLIGGVIRFCVDHVRDGRELIVHALLPNLSMGELYCPAPWEPNAESRLNDLLVRIEADLSCENHHARVVHQIGRLITPKESCQ
ncbi:hypothetical protein [Pseudomonas amygdali]|nr:hypothetical protein [Pseudomonas amygdali]AXH59833.1 hypothetical protein PLA107_031915 [Pseudomonas amygdali pv. lachrymans str. M301315]RMT06273.1 hypothetical protein ALP54_03715 [Pseudomonas amygdali pv. lachrymans]